MNCEKYLSLLPKEKTELIGKLIHAIQSDDQFFEMAQKMVKLADKKGLYMGITINPAPPIPDLNQQK